MPAENSAAQVLEVCPFCGGATFTRISAHAVRVHCQDCDGVGPRGSCEMMAAQLWNRRVPVSTPASTGDGESLRLALECAKGAIEDGAYGSYVSALNEAYGFIEEALAALPPSSGHLSQNHASTEGEKWDIGGWEAGAEAMREAAAKLCEAQAVRAISHAVDGNDYLCGFLSPQHAAAIRALPLPPRPADSSGWRDIETAPRDGTWVLIWQRKASVPAVAMFSYPEEGDQRIWWNGSDRFYNAPLGWMPLPPPPSREGV